MMIEKTTSKLYYGKFDHKVIVLSRTIRERSAKFKERPLEVDVIKVIDEATDGKFRSRTQQHMLKKKRRGWIRDGHATSLYFSGAEVLDKIKSTYPDGIVMVERPLNDEHSEMLSKDKVITRKSLFHRKYRYCVRVVANYHYFRADKSKLKEIAEWHQTTFEHLKSGVDYHTYSGWNKTNYFFKEAKDAMMMKLTWGEHISETERIVLLDEVNTGTE